MCLLALALHQHPRFPVVLAANRDEFHQRPTAPLQWWPAGSPAPQADEPLGLPPHGPGRVLGGRDLEAGGHWLALGEQGRVAALTNIREPAAALASARSRGEIVHHWVSHRAGSADHYAQWLHGQPFQGYNLLAGELGTDEHTDRWWHLRRGRPQAQPLTRGVHGLSNGDLDTPWPKLLRLREGTKAALRRVTAEAGGTACDVSGDMSGDKAGDYAGLDAAQLAETLFALLRDEARPADHELPDTGIGLPRERELGPVFIRAPHWGYGTRCSTVMIVTTDRTGSRRGWVWERSWDAEGRLSGEVREALPLELRSGGG